MVDIEARQRRLPNTAALRPLMAAITQRELRVLMCVAAVLHNLLRSTPPEVTGAGGHRLMVPLAVRLGAHA
eukprot:COSAG01_NODE_30561_length_613_cov_11.813230_1_plen_71_part_00